MLVATLPLGAWGDGVDFGSENSVSTSTLWTFDDLTENQQYYEENPAENGFPTIGNAYLRAQKPGRSFTVKKLESAESIVLADGSIRTINQYLYINAGAADLSKLTSGGTANTYSETHKTTGVFAFNAEVAGTVFVYMKGSTSGKNARIYHTEKVGSSDANTLSAVVNEALSTDKITAYSCTSTSKGTFYITAIDNAFDIYAIHFIPNPTSTVAISQETNFITGLPSSQISAITQVGNGLVYRSYTTSNKKISFENYNNNVTFGDGATVYVPRNLVTLGTIEITDWTMTSGDPSENNTSKGTPMVSFKTAVPGTIRAKFMITTTSDTEKGHLRMYYSEGSGTPVEKTRSSNYYDTDGIQELVYENAPIGSYFLGANKACKIYAVRFVPNTYTLTINAENGTVGRSSEKSEYDYNEVVTLTATPADGYKFVSWTGVDSSDGASATVTMSANKEVTAIFAKFAATTKWTFDQYEEGDAIFKDATTGASAGEYVNGLYFHSRDKKSDNHGVVAKKTKITSSDLVTHFGTYKKNTDYMGGLFGTGGGEAPSETTEAGASTNVDGISFKAPANGTFYATVVRSTNEYGVTVYKNGVPVDDVTFSTEIQAKEFEIAVATGDNIYLVSNVAGSKQFYLWNAGFVPTTADIATKTVSIGTAGKATFSATQNYTLPEGLKAYTVESTDDVSVFMNEIKTGVIPACTGVVLMGEQGDYTLTSTETATVQTDNLLKANIANYNLPATNNTKTNYTLAADGFKKSTGVGTLAAGKAFLRIDTPASGGAAKLALDFNGFEPTAIENVCVNESEKTEGKVYSITGQLVGSSLSNMPKGIYIVNGKKYINK